MKEVEATPANAPRTDRGLDRVLSLCVDSYNADIPSQLQKNQERRQEN